MAIDIENLLQPVSPDDIAGTNLEYDPAFAELERAVLGKPDQQMGDTIIAAEPPDWNQVARQASGLLARSKDLRVVGHLVRAGLHCDGFEGFADGLAVVQGLIDRYWAPLHPHLDPDDNNDPTIRVNALAVLSDEGTLAALRAAPLVRSRAFGPIGLRSMAIASGELTAQDGAAKLDPAAIEAAFQDAPIEALETTSKAIAGASADLRAIETLFTETLGIAGPDLSGVSQLLRQAMLVLKPRIDRRKADAAPAADGSVDATNGTGSMSRVAGEIGSRDDVVRALDKICAYYQRHEPSSPLPLLLQRCKRLATMSFIEIVREMVPDGIPQVEMIAGKREQS
jgi:type VI secretion system protein ImpA